MKAPFGTVGASGRVIVKVEPAPGVLAISDPLLVELGDADAVVPDAERCGFGIAGKRYFDRLSGTELDRVRHDVLDDLREGDAVPLAVNILGDAQLQRRARMGRRRALLLDRLAQQGREIDRLRLQRDAFSGGDARDVEQHRRALDVVLHHPVEPRQLTGDALRIGAGGRFDDPGQLLDAQIERRHRIAQLVRGHGDELIACTHRLCQLGVAAA